MKKLAVLLLGMWAAVTMAADVKISGLPAATTLTGTELVPIVQGGITSQTTVSAIDFLALPSMTSNSGKYLTTNGTAASWATTPVLTTAVSLPLASFGAAAGDGTSATTALTNAMNCTPTGASQLSSGTNLSVQIPAGTYQIAAQNYPAFCNVSLVGPSSGAAIIQWVASSSITGTQLQWVGKTGWTVQNLTFDLNGSTATSIQNIFLSTSSVGFKFLNNRVINASTFMNLIAADAATNFEIRGNYLALTAAATSQNQCINIISATAASKVGQITDNICVNTAIDINGSSINVRGNDISKWAFGGGIVTEQSVNSFGVLIDQNNIHDGATSQDVNATATIGIETWSQYSKISNNAVWNNGAEGIDIGGIKTIVVGNIVYNNGTRADAAKACGISGRYFNSTYNGNGSYVAGNDVFDTGGGNQIYGYCDQSASSNVVIDSNNFSGATANVNILGSTALKTQLGTAAVAANGTTTNQGLTFFNAGIGAYNFMTPGGLPYFIVGTNGTTTPANYMQVTANTTTNSPSLLATGSDTNVSMTIAEKGTGSLFFLYGNGTSGTVGAYVQGNDGGWSLYNAGVAPTGGDMGSGTLNAAKNLYLNGGMFNSPTAPTVTSGGGTSPTVNAKTADYVRVTEGTGSPSATLVMGFPAAPTGWSCAPPTDETSATITGRESADTTTSVTFTFSAAPAAGDKIMIQCGPY